MLLHTLFRLKFRQDLNHLHRLWSFLYYNKSCLKGSFFYFSHRAQHFVDRLQMKLIMHLLESLVLQEDFVLDSALTMTTPAHLQIMTMYLSHHEIQNINLTQPFVPVLPKLYQHHHLVVVDVILLVHLLQKKKIVQDLYLIKYQQCQHPNHQHIVHIQSVHV